MRATLRHVRILLGTRCRAASNRIRNAWSDRGPWRALAFLTATGATVGLGDVAAPALLEAPAEVAAGGSLGASTVHVPGTAALEAAFWLTLLASAVTSFRVMEILYRRPDLRAVEIYPIRLPALYLDRLAATAVESALAGGALSVFFLPLVWHGAAGTFGLALLVVFAGLSSSSAISFGIQVYAGRLNVRTAERDQPSRSHGAYGGPGQLFMFSPGVALAGSAVAILLVRLAVGELLSPGGSLRAFWFAFGLLGFASLVSLSAALRMVLDAYPTMCARFREADAVSYRAPVDYQVSDFRSGEPLEWLVPASVTAPFRALSLQYGRGYSLVRYSYAIGWILGGLAVAQWSRTAFPPWAIASAPALVAATAANPWYRLVRPPLRPPFARSLPLSSSDETSATLALAARELLLLAGPYALLVVWADWSQAGAAAATFRGAAALFFPLGLDGAVAATWGVFGPGVASSLITPVAAAVALLGVAIVSLPAATGLAGVAVVVAAVGIAHHPNRLPVPADG